MSTQTHSPRSSATDSLQGAYEGHASSLNLQQARNPSNQDRVSAFNQRVGTDQTLGQGQGEEGGFGGLAAVIEDLGPVDGMGALATMLNALCWTAAPEVGSSAKLSVSAQVLVEFVYAEFSLEASIKHTKTGWELGGGYGMVVGIGAGEADVSAHVGVFEKSSLALKGATPMVCVEEIGLYADQWLRDRQVQKSDFLAPQKWLEVAHMVFTADVVGIATVIGGDVIADLLFGRGLTRRVLADMATGDSVTDKQDVGIESTIAVSTPDKTLSGSGRTAIGYRDETTRTKGSDGALLTTNEQGVFVGLDFNATVEKVKIGVRGEVYQPLANAPPELSATVSFGLTGGGGTDTLARLQAAWFLARSAVSATVLSSQLGRDPRSTRVIGEFFAAEGQAALGSAARFAELAGVKTEIGVDLCAKTNDSTCTVSLGAYEKISASTGVEGEGGKVSASLTKRQDVASWTFHLA